MNCKQKLRDPLTHCTGSVTEMRSSTNTYCIFGKRRPSSSTSLSGEAEAPMWIVSRLRRSRLSHRLQTSEQASRLGFASRRRNISTINSSGRTPFTRSNPFILPQFQLQFLGGSWIAINTHIYIIKYTAFCICTCIESLQWGNFT